MIKIGIVDDHAVIRAGLRELFSTPVEFRVVGEGATGREASELVSKTEMDVLVMNLSMPGQSGLESLAYIRAKAPNLGVLILSGHAETQYAVNVTRQGASGFLSKDCDPSQILEAVRIVALGKRYISPTVADLLAGNLDRAFSIPAHELLSKREFSVFLRLAKGEHVTAIAAGLFLSIKTVSTYRGRVMEKMKLNSNPDLTYYALKNRLIE
jgi:two-component system invasion response regulator UvrY